MADTLYAWSRIVYGVEKDEDGNVLGPKFFDINDEVSQDALGVPDAEWQSLVDGQVVREVKLPESLQDTYRSPRQLMQDKLTQAQEGYDVSGPTDDLLKRFDDEGEVQSEELPSVVEAVNTPASSPAPGNGPSDA